MCNYTETVYICISTLQDINFWYTIIMLQLLLLLSLKSDVSTCVEHVCSEIIQVEVLSLGFCTIFLLNKARLPTYLFGCLWHIESVLNSFTWLADSTVCAVHKCPYWKWFWNEHKFFPVHEWNVSIQTFVDTFHSCYKDGTNGPQRVPEYMYIWIHTNNVRICVSRGDYRL